MDPFGSKALNLPKESISSPLAKDGGGKKIGSVDKQAAVHEEMKRMNQLPANSAYATHRLRVLNKVLQLLSIQNHIAGGGVGVAFFKSFYMNRNPDCPSIGISR